MGTTDPNIYYHVQLKSIVATLLRNTSALKQLVMVDRVPFVSAEDQLYTPTQPFNSLHSRRENW